jgi:hypothetical protein
MTQSVGDQPTEAFDEVVRQYRGFARPAKRKLEAINAASRLEDLKVPPANRVAPLTDHGTLPSLKWFFADSHYRLQPRGWARQTTIRELPIATELAGVDMRLEAVAIREVHWHKA